jgi:hypothetical protein
MIIQMMIVQKRKKKKYIVKINILYLKNLSMIKKKLLHLDVFLIIILIVIKFLRKLKKKYSLILIMIMKVTMNKLNLENKMFLIC